MIRAGRGPVSPSSAPVSELPAVGPAELPSQGCQRSRVSQAANVRLPVTPQRTDHRATFLNIATPSKRPPVVGSVCPTICERIRRIDEAGRLALNCTDRRMRRTRTGVSAHGGNANQQRMDFVSKKMGAFWRQTVGGRARAARLFQSWGPKQSNHCPLIASGAFGTWKFSGLGPAQNPSTAPAGKYPTIPLDEVSSSSTGPSSSP